MARTTKPVSFTFVERDIEFLANMVEKGRFGNRTEVVRAGLRLLEDYENNEKIKRLRALVAEGDADIEAGRVTEYDNAQALESSITS